jgi:hypothetical protein
MRKENSIFWFGKKYLAEIANGKIGRGRFFHFFVEDSKRGEAPLIRLFHQTEGDVLIQLEWSDLHICLDSNNPLMPDWKSL